MTTLRFDWQRQKVAQFASTDVRPILNVGCNEDPAGLKAYSAKVVNCDLHEYDETMGRPNKVDVKMDATEAPWPFSDDSCSLVILGDIIEHLDEAECMVALIEAGRVADHLAITVPHDPRFRDEPDYQEKVASMQRGAIHITEVSSEYLREMLDQCGWNVVEWQTVDYGFVQEGFFILAERR